MTKNQLPPSPSHSACYCLDGQTVELHLTGSIERGGDECLLDKDDNLADGCNWNDAGFTVNSILSESDFSELTIGVKQLVLEGLIDAGVCVNESDFELEKYHTLSQDQAVHLSVIDFLKRKASLKNFPIDPKILDIRVSQICGKPVSSDVGNVIASGYFFIRIVRPFPYLDNNPPHKDVWLERLRNAINLYLPIAGSDHSTSLPLVMGSHFWPESRIARTVSGAIVNGVRYSVPSVFPQDEVLMMSRPKVGPLQGLVFSPYLIHGGTVNYSNEKTRVSLEMRFWRSSDGYAGPEC